jgi:hypothetical protein
LEDWEELIISGLMSKGPMAEIFTIRHAFNMVTIDYAGRDMAKDNSVQGRDSAYVIDGDQISTKTLRDSLNYLAFDDIKIARALFGDIGWEIGALLEGNGMLIPDDSDSRNQTGFTVKAWRDQEGGPELKIVGLAAMEESMQRMLGAMSDEELKEFSLDYLRFGKQLEVFAMGTTQGRGAQWRRMLRKDSNEGFRGARFATGAFTKCRVACRAGGAQEKYKGKGSFPDCFEVFHPTTTVLLLFWSGLRDSIIGFFKNKKDICSEFSKATFDKFLFTNDCGDHAVYDASSSFNNVIKDTVEKINNLRVAMGFASDNQRTPFVWSSHRKLINLKLREIQRAKSKESGLDSMQQGEDVGVVEQTWGAHSSRTGDYYKATHEMSNSTVGRVPTIEVVDHYEMHETLAVLLGVGDVCHVIFDAAKSTDFHCPFIDDEFCMPFVERARERAALATNSGLAVGYGSISELVGLSKETSEVSDKDVRDKCRQWLDGDKAQVILDLCVKKVGGGGGEKCSFKPFQKEALVESLAAEVRQAQGDGKVGRTILLDAPCNGGKTLVVMFMALVYQEFMGVKEGGRYWVTLVNYLNVSVMLDQAQEMRDRGINVVTIMGSSAGGLDAQDAIREAERVRSREGNVTILTVVDSLMHPQVKKTVNLYIRQKWLTRMFEDEVQDFPGQYIIRGGQGGSFQKYGAWSREEGMGLARCWSSGSMTEGLTDWLLQFMGMGKVEGTYVR